MDRPAPTDVRASSTSTPATNTRWEERAQRLARLHRTAFDHVGVTARPKLTGRRGIQIWVPIGPDLTFAATRRWVETAVAERGRGGTRAGQLEAGRSTSVRGLARLDYTQNAINKTLVAPYSPRPAPGAPVSAPIEWDASSTTRRYRRTASRSTMSWPASKTRATCSLRTYSTMDRSCRPLT